MVHTRFPHRRRFLGWGLSLFLACLAHVSGAHSSSTLDLDTLVNSIQKSYDRVQALTANFVQITTLTSIDRQQTSTGRLYIQRPHYIRWEYTQPDAQTVLYDGTTLHIYTPKRQQVLRSTIDQDNRQNVALLFLAGVGRLQEAFTITPLPSVDAQTKQLRLLPRSRQAGYTELHIAVNRNHFVEKLTIHDTIGNLTEIHLSSLEAHPELPAQTFEFVLPPHTEILTPADLTGRR